jgi:hypothetical protein
MYVIDFAELSFPFLQKTGNSVLAYQNREKLPIYTCLPKTENNYLFTLAYQNREQLPVYTCLPKPRTITNLYG